jgi:FMN phosphatase YigB (HAD superfamily)
MTTISPLVVFFDWDYTLAYTTTPQNTTAERLAMMCSASGLPFSQEEIEAALQQIEQDADAGRIERVNEPQTRQQIAQNYRYLLDELGHDDKSWPLLLRLYGSYAGLPTHLYEDSRRAIAQVRATGHRTGIISNHSRAARPIMERLVGDLIPSRHIVISEEVGVHKPARTIFKRAAARLAVPPSACILVGDNLKVDALGAIENGGYCCGIWLDRRDAGRDTRLPPHIMRVTSLDELASLIGRGVVPPPVRLA